MGIKYYELKVKKLVNFAGVEYALTSDVVFKNDFDIFRNGVDILGTAASKNYAVYSGKNLGSFESWELAESGIAELNEGDVVYVGGVGYICTDATAETFQYRFFALDSCVTSIKDFIALSSEVEGKLDPEDVIAGDNIEISYNEDGTITITGSADPYVLPPAEEDVLGGIKLGDGLEKVYDDADGTVYTGKVEAIAKTKGDISITKDIGYLKKGSTIDAGTTLDDFLTQLLVAYITPVINSLSLSPSGPVEVGETVSLTKLTYKFSDDHTVYKKYLKPGTVKFYTGTSVVAANEITSKGTVSSGGDTAVNQTGTFAFTTAESITKASNTSQSYCVSCDYEKEDGSNGTVSKSGSISWQYAYFYAVSESGVIPTDVRADGTKVLNPALNKKVNLNADGRHKIVWCAYPKSVHGATADQTASSIIALDSMNAEVKTAFTYTDVTVTLANGDTVDYTLAYLMPDGGFTQQARYEFYI